MIRQTVNCFHSSICLNTLSWNAANKFSPFFLRTQRRLKCTIPLKSNFVYILIFRFKYFKVLKSATGRQFLIMSAMVNAVLRTVLVCTKLARFRETQVDTSQTMAWHCHPTRCKRAACIKESLEVVFRLSLTNILRSAPVLIFLYNWWLKTFTSNNEIHQHSFVRSKSVSAKTPALIILGVVYYVIIWMWLDTKWRRLFMRNIWRAANNPQVYIIVCTFVCPHFSWKALVTQVFILWRIARQRLAKHFPAETNTRNNTSITR